MADSECELVSCAFVRPPHTHPPSPLMQYTAFLSQAKTPRFTPCFRGALASYLGRPATSMALLFVLPPLAYHASEQAGVLPPLGAPSPYSLEPTVAERTEGRPGQV